jgi:hypothetical protein
VLKTCGAIVGHAFPPRVQNALITRVKQHISVRVHQICCFTRSKCVLNTRFSKKTREHDLMMYTTLHYTTLHYTTLHYTTPHQTTPLLLLTASTRRTSTPPYSAFPCSWPHANACSCSPAQPTPRACEWNVHACICTFFAARRAPLNQHERNG